MITDIIGVITDDILKTFVPFMKTKDIFLPTKKCPDGLAPSPEIVELELSKKTGIAYLLTEKRKDSIVLYKKDLGSYDALGSGPELHL